MENRITEIIAELRKLTDEALSLLDPNSTNPEQAVPREFFRRLRPMLG